MTVRRSLQWIALTTSVIASLWFYPATLDPFNVTKLAVLVVGAAGLLGVLGASVKTWWKREEWMLAAVVGAFVVGLTAAAVASPQNAYRTLWGAWARNDGWFAYFALAVILFAVALAFRGAEARAGAYVIAGVGVVEVLYSTLQTFGADPVAWSNSYNPILGTVGNPNFASALLGITGVLLAWVAFEASHPLALRVAGGVISLWAAWLTVRSESIQGTLAYAAGVALLLGGWLSMRERRDALRRLTWPYVGLMGLGGVVGVLGLAGAGPLAGLLNTQNLLNRKFYWQTAWNMFRDNPLFGLGLDSMGDYYRLYRSYDSAGMPGIEVTTNAAHSILFQLLATGGLAVTATYVLIQLFVMWRGIIALRSGDHRLLVSGLGGGWFAFQLQSMFSIDQLGLTVWGWVLGGLVIGVSYAAPARPAASKARTKSRAAAQTSNAAAPALIAGAVLALVAVPLVASPLGMDRETRTISSYSVDTTNQALVNATAQAILTAAEGIDDPYMLAQAVSKLYQINALQAGITLAEKSAREFPNDSMLWNLVAIAYEQTGNPAQAVEWRARTLELDPLNTEYQKLLEQDQAAKAKAAE